MSRIATCSGCHQRVTIPEGFGRGELVRCPLCQAEYPLSDALAEAPEGYDESSASEADDESEAPPELVLVPNVSEEGLDVESSKAEIEAPEKEALEADVSDDQPEEARDVDSSSGPEMAEEAEEAADEPQQPQDEGEQAAEAVQEPAAESEQSTGKTEEPETAEPAAESSLAASEDEIMPVRCPHCEAEYALAQVVVVSTGAELGPAVAAALARYILTGQAAESEAPALDVWAKADAMPQIDLGERAGARTVSADAAAFDFAKEGTEGEAAPAAAPAARPRRRKQKSMAGEIAGWLFGAVAGLVIAYYLLNFIRGEAGNFLKIPLPGVPHTYKYSPAWFPGFLKPAPDADSAPADEILDLTPADSTAQADDADGTEAADAPSSSPASSHASGSFGAAIPAPAKPGQHAATITIWRPRSQRPVHLSQGGHHVERTSTG